MKVTAIIPENLVQKVRRYAQRNNLTECLIVALKEWVELRGIKALNEQIEAKPLHFDPCFKAKNVRNLNRT